MFPVDSWLFISNTLFLTAVILAAITSHVRGFLKFRRAERLVVHPKAIETRAEMLPTTVKNSIGVVTSAVSDLGFETIANVTVPEFGLTGNQPITWVQVVYVNRSAFDRATYSCYFYGPSVVQDLTFVREFSDGTDVRTGGRKLADKDRKLDFPFVDPRDQYRIHTERCSKGNMGKQPVLPPAGDEIRWIEAKLAAVSAHFALAVGASSIRGQWYYLNWWIVVREGWRRAWPERLFVQRLNRSTGFEVSINPAPKS